MANFENLYRAVIMDHYKTPRNKGLLNDNDYVSTEFLNPSCGDEVIVQFKIDNDNNIKDIRHDGKGCSICCSSASIMSEALITQSKDQALEIINEFYEMIKGNEYNAELINGDILAFTGVSTFAARVKCATLAWKALEKGLRKNEEKK